MLALVAVLGCNDITGASDLVLVDDFEGEVPAPDDEDATSAQGGSSSSAGPGGSTIIGVGGSSSTGEVEPDPMAAADGVFVTDLDLYQAIRRPIVEDGQPTTSSIPIVAGRDAMLRVFYQTDGSYNGQEVTTRFIVGDNEPVERNEVLSGSSSHGQLSSTINLQIPGDLLTPGAQFRLEILQQANSVGGSNSEASYPSGDGTAALDVEVGGKTVKILLVPVSYNGTLPDTSPEQVQRYERWFSEQYPVPNVEISVRSTPYSFNGNLGSYNGWSNLLDQLTDLRDSDGAPDDQYYYGIHDADGGGLLGLGWIGGASDVWSRTAIGVGWTGDTAPETAVHELGHNHGRDHAPCGVSGDSNYPHSGASIGVWGYRPSDKKLLDPSDYVDFMSYCSPTWISDYQFKAIFNRIKQVDQSAKVYFPPELQNQQWERIKIIDGQVEWKEAKLLTHPPVGSPIDVTVHSGLGSAPVVGHLYKYDHIDGGVIYLPKANNPTPAQLATKVNFTWSGQAIEATRTLSP